MTPRAPSTPPVDHATAAHNSGPCRREILRTARVGACHVLPTLAHVESWLAANAPAAAQATVPGCAERHAAIVVRAVPAMAVRLGHTPPTTRAPDALLAWLHATLLQARTLPALVGWLEAATSDTDVHTPPWPPADPTVGATDAARAHAAAVALLAQAIAVPPLLLWRRAPRLDRLAHTGLWHIRTVHGTREADHA